MEKLNRLLYRNCSEKFFLLNHSLSH